MATTGVRYNHILIAYGELSLKSGPVRKRFMNILIQNIRSGLKQANINFEINKTIGRIFIKTQSRYIEKTSNVLKRVFGVAYFSPYIHLELNKLEHYIKKNWKKFINPNKTFAVRVRRRGKHDFTSQELASKIGSYINAPVNLTRPDQTLYIEVKNQDCHIFTKKIRGLGGMPVGTAGKVVCLISGGIDSPVAAWLMMKRGCDIIPLFAHFPENGKPNLKRFIEIVRVLQEWSVGRKLRAFTFKHNSNLKEFRKVALKYTCILCKRMMYRVANELAKRMDAKAIVTGENLGQVASQTLDNLRVINTVSELPVLRPLIGNDKKENIEVARMIGTYDKSCMKIEPCWAVPKRPVTKAKLKKILEIEGKIDMEKLVTKSIKSIEEITDMI